MPTLIHHFGLDNYRIMIFVDGENLAIRFKQYLKDNPGMKKRADLAFRDDTYVWWKNLSGGIATGGAVLRTHYYTSVKADHPTIDEVTDELKNAGVEAPRVFKKTGNRSKRVDIMLTTEMLQHATHGNYDIAVLVAGDEDYVPLVDAVRREGRGVHLWSVPSGLSSALVRAADEYRDLARYFTGQDG